MGWQRLIQHTRNDLSAIWRWRCDKHRCGQWAAHLAVHIQGSETPLLDTPDHRQMFAYALVQSKY